MQGLYVEHIDKGSKLIITGQHISNDGVDGIRSKLVEIDLDLFDLSDKPYTHLTISLEAPK